jgi:hypothetical protein
MMRWRYCEAQIGAERFRATTPDNGDSREFERSRPPADSREQNAARLRCNDDGVPVNMVNIKYESPFDVQDKPAASALPRGVQSVDILRASGRASGFTGVAAKSES